MDGGDNELLRKRLREAREYLNLTQQFVADRTGISRSAIAEIESGKRRVQPVELKRLAQLYRHRVSYFLGEEEPSVPEDSQIMHALARAAGELTDQDRQEVLRYAEFLRFRRKPQDESGR